MTGIAARLGTGIRAWGLPLTLALACLLFAGLVWRGLTGPLPAATVPAATAAGDAQADGGDGGPAFAAEPIEAFAAVIERPLFSRARRPAPPERAVASDAKPGENASPFVLSGVLIAGANRVAFLKPVADVKTLRVLEGETIEGWKVEKILPQRVVIGNGTVSAELTLRDRILPAGTGVPPADKAATARPPAEHRPGVPDIPGMQRPDDIPPETYDEGIVDHEQQ